VLLADECLSIFMPADKSVAGRQGKLAVFGVGLLNFAFKELVVNHSSAASRRGTDDAFKFSFEKIYDFVHFGFPVCFVDGTSSPTRVSLPSHHVRRLLLATQPGFPFQ
jgi:hypothetical protein